MARVKRRALKRRRWDLSPNEEARVFGLPYPEPDRVWEVYCLDYGVGRRGSLLHAFWEQERDRVADWWAENRPSLQAPDGSHLPRPRRVRRANERP